MKVQEIMSCLTHAQRSDEVGGQVRGHEPVSSYGLYNPCHLAQGTMYHEQYKALGAFANRPISGVCFFQALHAFNRAI